MFYLGLISRECNHTRTDKNLLPQVYERNSHDGQQYESGL